MDHPVYQFVHVFYISVALKIHLQLDMLYKPAFRCLFSDGSCQFVFYKTCSDKNWNICFPHVTYCFCVVGVVSIKNDFVAQLHKFMASLTDTRWKMDGKTVLYIPHEGTVVPVSPTTAKNKELIHRLESMTSFRSVAFSLM